MKWRKKNPPFNQSDWGQEILQEDARWKYGTPPSGKHNFVLTPGRYVGIIDAIDDGIPFADKMNELTTKLGEQMAREKELDEEIKRQLAKIGFVI